MGLNHAQRLALNLDSHLVIDAGAGTGKTKTIVEKYRQWWDKDKKTWKKGFKGHGNS